jgi:hypothetical protein
MPIVAYGYGIDTTLGVTNVLVDDIVLAMEAEPVITLDDEVTLTLDTDDVNITLDEDIDIEVD